MAMTNAEKQAAWRQRRQQELDRLRAQQPSRPEPQPAAPSPFADCTEEEVDMLRAVLTEWRDNEPQRRAEQARRDDVANACAEMRAQRAEEYAALSPAEKAMHDKEVADRKAAMEAARATAGQRKAEAKAASDAARAKHAAQLDAIKPAAGTYWWVPTTRIGGKPSSKVEQIEIVHNRAGTPMWVDDGKRRKLDTSFGRWQIGNGYLFYSSKEEAEKYAAQMNAAWEAHGRDRKQRAEFADKTIEELRRIRSEHHPDKGNAHADPTLYQQAVEELDRRRG